MLLNKDMFDVFPSLQESSVHAIITDFPYGTLNKRRNLWDEVIDYSKFWVEAKRI